MINLEEAGRIVLLLDPAELLTRAERGLLDTFQAKSAEGGCVDQGTGGRRFRAGPQALRPRSVATSRNSRCNSRATAWKPGAARKFQAGRRHPRRADAADERLECLDRIMVQRPWPVVMVSSVTAKGAEATLEALRLGAVDFVAKPDGRGLASHRRIRAAVHRPKYDGRATAKLRASRRLKERVQFRVGAAARRPPSIQARDVQKRCRTHSGRRSRPGGNLDRGPPALEALLAPLPATFPWPILVAQHMPAGFTGPLARRLDGICALKVVEASSPMPLQAGCVYIGRGDADIIVSKRARGLVVMPAPAKANYPWHPSTDRLVRSAMENMPHASSSAS